MMAPRRRAAAVVASWSALGLAVVVLHVAGSPLPTPPVGAPSTWSAWLAGRDPVVVAFGVVRVLALGVAWYGLVVTVAGVCLRLVSAQHLAVLVDHLTVVPLRRLVSATVAVGLSATTLAATGAGATMTTTSVPPAAVPAPVSTTVVGGPVAALPGAPPATVSMHRLNAADSAPPAARPAGPPPGPAVDTTRRPADGRAPTDTWTVEPGQCFWSIAEATLGRAWGRPPTADEIVAYWHRLIEANRAELTDPGNADLVFPGQVFALPAP